MSLVILGSVYYGAEPAGIPRDSPYGLAAQSRGQSKCSVPVVNRARGRRVLRFKRGNNRGACCRFAVDQALYLSFLRELAPKFGCLVHAYCLMPNHVHLLMTPASAEACAAMMRDLGQRYVRHFNRRYGRSGTLWEGRFRSCLTDAAHYVLACYRYIELNPVRAGLPSIRKAMIGRAIR